MLDFILYSNSSEVTTFGSNMGPERVNKLLHLYSNSSKVTLLTRRGVLKEIINYQPQGR